MMFRKLWQGLKRGAGVVGRGTAALFHSEQMRHAVVLAEEAAQTYLMNDAKRAFVTNQLMKRFHLPESAARLLTESAVKVLKSRGQ